MSLINGDKSRAHRKRKFKAAQRAKVRIVRAALYAPQAGTVVSAPAGAVKIAK